MKFKHVILSLLVLPIISACSQSDDVIAIFSQGEWKLTSIFKDNNKGTDVCKDYWNDDASYDASQALLDISSNFVITFTGVEIEEDVTGTYTGRASTNPISGNWSANGKNNSFSISGQSEPATGEDVLGKAFINALINAYKYEGDTNGNLRIYFKEGNNKKFLLFHLSK